MHEKQQKAQVVQCICFPGHTKYFVGRKWPQGSFYGQRLTKFTWQWIMLKTDSKTSRKTSCKTKI